MFRKWLVPVATAVAQVVYWFYQRRSLTVPSRNSVGGFTYTSLFSCSAPYTYDFDTSWVQRRNPKTAAMVTKTWIECSRMVVAVFTSISFSFSEFPFTTKWALCIFCLVSTFLIAITNRPPIMFAFYTPSHRSTTVTFPLSISTFISYSFGSSKESSSFLVSEGSTTYVTNTPVIHPLLRYWKPLSILDISRSSISAGSANICEQLNFLAVFFVLNPQLLPQRP